MKKKNVVILSVALVVISSALTFGLSNLIQLNLGDKVLLSLDAYQGYQALEEKYSKVEELNNFIDTHYYTDTSKVDFKDGILKGMFAQLKDPYSIYMNEEDFKAFTESTTGTYGGVGLHLWVDKDGFITVVSPMEGSPAQRAGILSGDIIFRVDDLDVSGDNYEEAVTHMRGEPNTKVKVMIKRKGVVEPLTIELTREMIKVKTVKTEVLDGNIGYLRFSAFEEDSSKEFISKMNDLKAKGIKGLIVDLRQNGGGSLYECEEIADALLGKQVVVYTQDRQGKKEYYYSDDRKLGLPIVVLVDGGSASASEILTGAIKDTKSGIIVGEKTFGKGIVQSVIALKDNTAIKLTTSQYFTPNGINIHGKGIMPDVEVKAGEVKPGSDAIDPVGDPQLKKAIEVMKGQIK